MTPCTCPTMTSESGYIVRAHRDIACPLHGDLEAIEKAQKEIVQTPERALALREKGGCDE